MNATSYQAIDFGLSAEEFEELLDSSKNSVCEGGSEGSAG